MLKWLKWPALIRVHVHVKIADTCSFWMFCIAWIYGGFQPGQSESDSAIFARIAQVMMLHSQHDQETIAEQGYNLKDLQELMQVLYLELLAERPRADQASVPDACSGKTRF